MASWLYVNQLNATPVIVCDLCMLFLQLVREKLALTFKAFEALFLNLSNPNIWRALEKPNKFESIHACRSTTVSVLSEDGL